MEDIRAPCDTGVKPSLGVVTYKLIFAFILVKNFMFVNSFKSTFAHSYQGKICKKKKNTFYTRSVLKSYSHIHSEGIPYIFEK
ncbi:UNVERIFIED_CONTAM: hypothetical protein NCL1_35511 [Trichonephila clavipes]